jgi:uncharacterized protein YegL
MQLDHNNPKLRLPVGFCLDVSSSMGGAIDELNAAFQAFRKALIEDEVVGRSAELAVVAFAHDVFQLVDFVEVYRSPELLALTVRMGGQLTDGTNIGAAVNHVIDLLEQRRAAYIGDGWSSYQPMLVVMSDGEPNDSEMVDELDRAAIRTRALESAGKLTVFPVAVGPAATLPSLAKLSARATPAQMTSREFWKFFVWVKESMRQISVSSPGARIEARELPEGIRVDASALGQGWKIFKA